MMVTSIHTPQIMSIDEITHALYTAYGSVKNQAQITPHVRRKKPLQNHHDFCFCMVYCIVVEESIFCISSYPFSDTHMILSQIRICFSHGDDFIICMICCSCCGIEGSSIVSISASCACLSGSVSSSIIVIASSCSIVSAISSVSSIGA
jgi:hypothetical protein